MKTVAVVFTLFGFCIALSPLQAQDLEDMVSKYTSVNGQGYMQPLGDAFGANINSGLFHGAGISKDEFNIRFSLEFMLAPIGDDRKVFMAQTEAPFYPDTTVEAPTVFGDSEGTSVEGTGGTVFYFPGGFDVNNLPFLVPQVTIGSIMGTQAVFRYINFKVDDNIGKVKLFGFGLRHSVSQWIEKEYPVDLAVAFFTQSFDVGDIVDASAKYFGIIGSYDAGILTLYGGPGFESSSLDIAYDIEADTDTTSVSFELDGDNSARFTLGAAVDLKILRFHIDYNIASQSSIGFGFGLGM
ncbi:MAG: DUF6588 family protein [Candidatus Glassbacteria bacterium]